MIGYDTVGKRKGPIVEFIEWLFGLRDRDPEFMDSMLDFAWGCRRCGMFKVFEVHDDYQDCPRCGGEVEVVRQPFNGMITTSPDWYDTAHHRAPPDDEETISIGGGI